MAITESSRHHLHQRLDEVLGPVDATTLMEHLPPVGWADVATKRDLDHMGTILEMRIDQVETSLTSRIDGLDRRMDALDSRTDSRFDSLDNRFDSLESRMDSLESRMDSRFDSLESRTDSRFDSLETRMDSRFDSLDTAHTERTDRVEGALILRIDKFASDLRAEFQAGLRRQFVELIAAIATMLTIAVLAGHLF